MNRYTRVEALIFGYDALSSVTSDQTESIDIVITVTL